MISNELKNKIMPNLRLILLEENYNRIEGMFEKCYKLPYTNDYYIVVLHDDMEGEVPALAFSSLTGSFVETCCWEYAKINGELL